MVRQISRSIRNQSRFVALCAGLIAVLVSVSAALAHARYDHSTPGQGEVVQTAPAQVDIYTAQDMQKQAGADEITVERNDTANSGGQVVSNGPTMVDDNNRRHFFVALQPNLPAGRYVVSFKNVSDEDGEADHGQFAFYVGTGPTAAQKALDARLAITSQDEDAKHSDSHTGLIIGIVVAVVVVIALIAAGLFIRQRRRPASV
jgi:methionine-rich copper-binding protein CopC